MSAFRVPCPTCRAPEGSRCTTVRSGRPARTEHVPRWDAYLAKLRGEASRWLLLKDDDRHGLREGDVLIGSPYWLDPDKVTVDYRESDGVDPMCNEYRSDLKWLGWAPERAA